MLNSLNHFSDTDCRNVKITTMKQLSVWLYSTFVFCSLLLPATFIVTQNACADEVYTFIIKKQEEKAKTRWSLAEWLETRDKMRLMDLWLALHSPSPYEFYLSGAYLNNSSSAVQGWDFSAAAYASIFGLGVERQVYSGIADTSGLFFLRIFGFQSQGTNITLQAGLTAINRPEERFQSALAGISSNLYLAKFFGLEGLYRRAVKQTRYETGAFIDFRFLRVYGKYFNTTVEFNSGLRTNDHGSLAGVKLFF